MKFSHVPIRRGTWGKVSFKGVTSRLGHSVGGGESVIPPLYRNKMHLSPTVSIQYHVSPMTPKDFDLVPLLIAALSLL